VFWEPTTLILPDSRFHLGRIKEGDKAVAVVNIDSQPNSETIRELREVEGVLNVSTVVL